MTDSATSFMSSRTSFRSLTLPHIPSGKYYQNIEETFANITAKFAKDHWIAGSTLAFQALPPTVGKASEERGGNAMGLSSKDKTRFILEIAGVWNNKADDAEMLKLAKQLTERLEKDLHATQRKDATLESYNPYFMNDAGPDQDVTSTYKDTATFAKMQKSVDPNGLFAKRAGGYKFKAVV